MEEKPASYERVVYKNFSDYHYMKIYLVCEGHSKTLSPEQFKQLIISGVKDLYGEVGAAFPFDLLTFDQSALSAILRVHNRGLVKLWSALTLIGAYENKACAFRVTQVGLVKVFQKQLVLLLGFCHEAKIAKSQTGSMNLTVSPFLLALSGNSREMDLY